MKTGTLNELNVRPGDRVECVACECPKSIGDTATIATDGRAKIDGEGCFFDPRWDESFSRKFRIVSRASDTPRPFGEWVDEGPDFGSDAPEPGLYTVLMNYYLPHFSQEEAIALTNKYLVGIGAKPAPVRETVKRSLHGQTFMGYVAIDLVDGEPDWTSIRKWEDQQ